MLNRSLRSAGSALRMGRVEQSGLEGLATRLNDVLESTTGERRVAQLVAGVFPPQVDDRSLPLVRVRQLPRNPPAHNELDRWSGAVPLVRRGAVRQTPLLLRWPGPRRVVGTTVA